MNSVLYIVATPIGNLKDASLRSLDVLRKVDFVLCEDTRATKKLLEHYHIGTPVISYHQHSKLRKIDYIVGLLRSGKNLALVSDAGTPGISDPGNELVGKVIESLKESVKVVPIPGPSALTAAASVAGFNMNRFLFLGFPPAKKKRKKFFEEIAASKYPVIFYESPYRITKTLKQLELQTKNHELKSKIVVCRELTKKFETILRGTPEQILNRLPQDKIRGEFVAIVDKR